MEELTLLQAFGWEFFGTAVLMTMGIGVNAANSLRTSAEKGTGWLMIAIGWGLAVFAGASIADPSGGHLNPAVTLAQAIRGVTPWNLVPGYVLGQVLGSITGAFLAYVAYKQLFDANNVDDKGNITGANKETGGIFYTGPAEKNYLWNSITEFIATAMLLSFIVFGPSDGALGSLKYFAVGFMVILIGMSLGAPTGYAINPVRDFGPRFAYQFLIPLPDKQKVDWSYAPVPIIAPLLAGVAVAGLALLIGV